MADDEKTLPGNVPKRYAESVRDYTFIEAEPLKEAVFDRPIQIGGPPPAVVESWEAARERSAKAREFIAANDPSKPIATEVLPAGWELQQIRPELIGIAGSINADKSTVAGMVPDALVLEFADPIYAMLSAMLGIPETVIRQRAMKNLPLPLIGKTVRDLSRTLGTEWGRDHVKSDLWILLAKNRVTAAFARGITRVVIAGVRFENEAEWIRASCGTIWHVRSSRPRDTPTTHSSDAGINQQPGDVVITNDGTLDELFAAVRSRFQAPERA
jgi:hypothetical protein